MTSEIDPLDMRKAAGQFLTGVTVVTTLDRDGNPAGLTANSFTSVSLHPPLVLVSVAKDANTIEAFEAGNGFVVHVLGADQEDIARRFSSKGVDRFAETDWHPGLDELPVIPGAVSVFECRNAGTYEGGDHLLFIGRVERLTFEDDAPATLGYFRGRYVTSPMPV